MHLLSHTFILFYSPPFWITGCMDMLKDTPPLSPRGNECWLWIVLGFNHRSPYYSIWLEMIIFRIWEDMAAFPGSLLGESWESNDFATASLDWQVLAEGTEVPATNCREARVAVISFVPIAQQSCHKQYWCFVVTWHGALLWARGVSGLVYILGVWRCCSEVPCFF